MPASAGAQADDRHRPEGGERGRGSLYSRPMILTPWKFIMVALAGWMNRQQQDAISYLKEENRVLREKLGHRRIILNDSQKRRLGVIERGSTSVLAIDDPLVAEAVALIRQQAQGRMGIDQLAAAMKVSRRTLYRRFVNVLGRTPGEEIRRARLETARRLIIGTDLKLAAIADRVGFPSMSQLSRDVEKEFSLRPSELRRRSRQG